MQDGAGFEYGDRGYHLAIEFLAEAGSTNVRDGRMSERLFRSHVMSSEKSCLECYRKDSELLKYDFSYVINVLTGKNIASRDPYNKDIIIVKTRQEEIKL